MSALPRLQPQFVRLALSEVAAISAIEATLYEFPWTAGNFRDALQAGNECWGCRVSGELAGYMIVMFAVDEAHLLNLSVVKDWQGCGLGRASLAWAIRQATGHGYIRMLLEVRPSNPVARLLYESAGFRRIGVRRGYYPARVGREDTWVMERLL